MKKSFPVEVLISICTGVVSRPLTAALSTRTRRLEVSGMADGYFLSGEEVAECIVKFFGRQVARDNLAVLVDKEQAGHVTHAERSGQR